MGSPLGSSIKLAIGLLAILYLGCRSSDVVTSTKHYGTVYDTAYEKLLMKENVPPLLKVWEKDVLVYSEPVAVVGWNEGVSTWELFFGTNREAETANQESDRVRFGNGVSRQPTFGRAEITLPRRRRGVDVATEPQPEISLLGGRKTEPEPVDLSTIDVVETLSSEGFLTGIREQVARSRQNDVLLFVHGFNVDFDSCVVRASQVALDMPFNGAVVAYSWPSQGGVKNYAIDEPINAASVEPFLQFLTQLREGLDDDTKIHIVVHSMGNRIVLNALSNWSKTHSAESKPIDNLALMAPDVGLSDFGKWSPGVVECCRRVTLYASIHDAALIASKSLHNEQRAGDAHPPVIVEGIETIDCSAIDITSMLGHGYYSSNVFVLSDLFQVIKRDHSASERAHLKERKTNGGVYWRWTDNAPRDLWTWHFEHLAEDVAQSASHTEEASVVK